MHTCCCYLLRGPYRRGSGCNSLYARWYVVWGGEALLQAPKDAHPETAVGTGSISVKAPMGSPRLGMLY